MLSEIIIGLWKSAWVLVPVFGMLIVGAIYERR